MADKGFLKVPYSKINWEILEKMKKIGYLQSVQKKGRGVKKIIDVELCYDKNHHSAISDIKIISRPSRKIYRGYRDLRRSRQGYGHYFLSTPLGIMTEVEAKKEKVGGQVLFEIW